MLGYGLVEVPQQLWNSSKRGHRLNQAYFKVGIQGQTILRNTPLQNLKWNGCLQVSFTISSKKIINFPQTNPNIKTVFENLLAKD